MHMHVALVQIEFIYDPGVVTVVLEMDLTTKMGNVDGTAYVLCD